MRERLKKLRISKDLSKFRKIIQIRAQKIKKWKQKGKKIKLR